MFRGFLIKKVVSFLAKMDGADGFKFTDLVEFVRQADTFTEMAGMDKANQVIKWAIEAWRMNGGWIVQTIAQLAYAYARIHGVIKR